MPQPYPNGELVIVIDCADLDRSARFWAAVLGYEAGPGTSGPYLSLTPVSGVGIDVLLQRVPTIMAASGRSGPNSRRGWWGRRWSAPAPGACSAATTCSGSGTCSGSAACL